MTNPTRIAICAGLALAACGKKKAASTSEAAPTPKPAASTPAPAPAPAPVPPPAPPDAAVAPSAAATPAPDPAVCGAAHVAGGGAVPFCIRLPDGYKQDGKPAKPDNWTNVDFKKKDSIDINTEWTDGVAGYDNLVEILHGDGTADGHTLVASGAIAGGAGAFIQYDSTPKSDPGDHQISFEAVYKGPKGIIRCSTSWWTNQPTGQAAADACKSLAPQ